MGRPVHCKSSQKALKIKGFCAVFIEILFSEGEDGGVVVVEFTVKVKVVVLITPPPVPVTVIVKVPAGVEVAVAMFKVREQVGLQEVDVA